MISEVFLQDCMEGMKTYPDKYFDLAVVDPPYGIGAGGKRFMNGTSKAENNIYKDVDWDIKPDVRYFNELLRVSKNQIIWGANHFISRMPYDSSCWIFWDKGTGNNSYADGELAWTSFDKTVRKFIKSWVGANAKDGIERVHPTQKPISLYDWLFKNYLPEGGKVLDTHLGSGSNRIAADKSGNIDFTGYEIDKDYYEAQEKRWKNYKAQLTMFA